MTIIHISNCGCILCWLLMFCLWTVYYQLVFPATGQIRKPNMIDIFHFEEQGADTFQKTFVDVTNKLGLGRHDRSMKYLIHDHLIVGRNFTYLSRTLGVTLTTHSTLSDLVLLPQLAKAWSGPVSVSLYLSVSQYRTAMTFLSYLISNVSLF